MSARRRAAGVWFFFDFFADMTSIVPVLSGVANRRRGSPAVWGSSPSGHGGGVPADTHAPAALEVARRLIGELFTTLLGPDPVEAAATATGVDLGELWRYVVDHLDGNYDLLHFDSIPASLADELLASTDADVVAYVSRNRRCSAGALGRAARRWGFPARVHDVRLQRLAGNPSLPEQLLRDLAACSSVEVRRHASANAALPVDVIAAMATDSDPGVRSTVAGRPEMPPAQLEALAETAGLGDDDAEWMRLKIAQNPAAPIELLEALAADSVSFVANVARAQLSARRDTPGD